ncbi:capsular polysaccharide biosynthesis protein [Bacillus taeanensis]|uniref:Capsular polysaccharide biosynthesis protein n=1 Tax=Bacillus taeanensis TaxID=273032 RepID=A0A366XRD4_9BACI|nr:capsular polysaccharide biosynthesis protein [Bacillus taeanensis]RBW68900.1 capsular polysaccharide biosynthesis protein [Bacillus taeanensis]
MSKVKQIIKSMLNAGQLFVKLIQWTINPLHTDKQKVAFVFNVSKWKQSYIRSYLSTYKVVFVPAAEKLWGLSFVFKRTPNKIFVVWGYKEDKKISQYAETHGIQVVRIEDGFVRSVGLGAMHTAPFSLCMDWKGMYFDSTKPSDLEELLNTYHFNNDPLLLKRAVHCIKMLNELGISKYNHVKKREIAELYGPKTKKRVLVIGQVEDDASIKMGSDKRWTNNDLVRLARKENSDAEIIYKPHPDVLTGRRLKQSDPNEIKDIAKVIEEPLSLVDSLKTIDHVYTITSLSGFEALIRGIKVTTVGAPFYSGWGLTDDRQLVTRRKRKLTTEELFAGAYILYPKYIDPYRKEVITIEEAIERISQAE